MGGYVVGGPSADELFPGLGDTLRQQFEESAKLTKAQELGLGPKAYEQLMQQQQDWEAQRDSGGPYVKQSPLMRQEMANMGLQQNLGLNDTDFKQLMKRQSQWQESVESGDPYVKQSPVMQATLAKDAALSRPALDPAFGR